MDTAPAPVIYLLTHREISGAELSHSGLIAADADALVACPPDSPAERFAVGLGAQTTPLPYLEVRHSAGAAQTFASALRALRLAVAIRRVLRRHPDRRVVFAAGTRPALTAVLAAPGLRRRVVWAAHDFLPPRPLRGPIRTLAWFGAAAIQATSEAVGADIVGRSRRLSRLTRVVNPGADPATFAPAPTTGSPTAATVGHISPTKQTGDAIKIAAKVLAQVPDFKLRIVGGAIFRDEDFALERELKTTVAGDSGLAAAVSFLGQQSDVAAALSGCRLLLHCRDDEPFGIVVIEAMAAGLPVVVPASAGPAEIVVDGETGLLYPPGDLFAAAAAVTRLCSDAQLAARLGRAGRERFEQRYTLPRNIAASQDIIRGVVGA